MAYHLTILRSANSLQQPISRSEALAGARQTAGWRVTGEAEVTFSDGRGSCTLWHSDGELWTRLDEPWVIEPMLALARALNARVRGDEFETYSSPQESYAHPDDKRLAQVARADSAQLLAQHMAEQRRIRNGIFAFFAVLGVLGFLIGKWFEGR
ncbi:hypothetical protein GTP41_14875 [Pseudoduganella sp. DS3]|uniref:Uncharacterized protein n=1 Tax=Pseudoduganella guangdongensis TaxID=2692179 RepID=A0A6N9HJB5_9BURK|nr:hypothetical protein [Pseudoduganella guangdongensis]MYN03377.1 hypothetical protein [Pseudoduganella guangdongensis]